MAKLLRLNGITTAITRQDVITKRKHDDDKGINNKKPYQKVYDDGFNLIVECVVCKVPVKWSDTIYSCITIGSSGYRDEKVTWVRGTGSNILPIINSRFIQFPMNVTGRACVSCLSTHEHKAVDEQRVKVGDIKSKNGW